MDPLAPPPSVPLFDLHGAVGRPVVVQSIELLRRDGNWFVRARSTEGAAGVALCNPRIEDLWPILQRRVAPFFAGRDACDLETLVDGVYPWKSNYKYAGIALWCCVGWMDFVLLDLMGQTAGKPVAELLGGMLRREVRPYLSSMRRDTTPEQEIEWLSRDLAETKATAVKLKIGGRMSRNADASPGRTERLIPFARRAWGEDVGIFVDANGSYDSAKAIEVGRMLEANGVEFFEEPCPFEEYGETKRVADALSVPVAGGEQDSSLHRFSDMIRARVVDIVQPDVNYCGGLIRASRVARMAAEAGLPVLPHSPQPGANAAYVLQFAACTPNFGSHFEFRVTKPEPFATPHLRCEDGTVAVPTGPGFGLTYDPDYLAAAETVFAVRAGD